jgi:ribosomal protein S18 acetylase RimI-like enzyme
MDNVRTLDNNMQPAIIIRNTQQKDVSQIVALQKESFPDVAAGMISAPSFLENHICIFPEGQFCAELNERIVASACSLIISLQPEYAEHTWYDIVGDRKITSHNPKGDSLYADDISTHPNFRCRGIATMLYNIRKDLAIKLNLRRIIGGGRLVHYCKYADKMSAMEYAQKIINGKLKDPVLSFQLKNGFRFIKILPNYIYDSPSLNYASFIEWLNPKYR